MSRMIRAVRLQARAYADRDDCLSATVVDVARNEGVEEWQCTARWADDQRDEIVVEVQS